MTKSVPIYLETGKKRVFAAALEWPGWSRSGRDEASALQALYDSAARYASVLADADADAGADAGLSASIDFKLPAGLEAFEVVERLEGNASTDFGAPDAVPTLDTLPVDAAEVERLQRLLKAYWKAFDQACDLARGIELRKGPRGGGRELEAIISHVIDAERAYLSRLGWKAEKSGSSDTRKQLETIRQAILEGLEAGGRGELPTQGPRGGKIWSPRTFARRSGWHVLDHAWEVEERSK